MKMGNTVTFSVSGMQLGTQTAVFHQEMRRMVLYGGEWLDVPAYGWFVNAKDVTLSWSDSA